MTSDASWLNSGRLTKVRSILLGLTVFLGLLIWVAFSLGLTPQGTHLVTKLRAIGIMTWLYAGLILFVASFALFPIRTRQHP